VPKLRMYRGLPGSGKTTGARKEVVDSGNAGRVNRDDLRAMLFDSVWTGKREGVVVDCEKALAKVLLANQMTPLIDDTNLSSRHKDMWSRFAKEQGAAFEMVDCSQPLPVCVERDARRPKPIGEAIINRMALNAGLIDFGDKPIIIVDVDGTIANGEHREKLLEGEKKDWKAYYALLHLDTPIVLIINRVNEMADTHTILIVSGRPDTYQHGTLKWLREVAKVKFDYFFQRAGNDKREDSIIKKEILDKLPKEKIVLVLDDRPRVCRMWEAEGLNVEWVRGRDCEEF
jgi:predicted kinase